MWCSTTSVSSWYLPTPFHWQSCFKARLRPPDARPELCAGSWAGRALAGAAPKLTTRAMKASATMQRVDVAEEAMVVMVWWFKSVCDVKLVMQECRCA
jgi:hypothetical protein